MVGVTKSHDEELLEQLDPNLRPEDEGIIRRYLSYADTLLGSPDEHGVTLVPGGGPAKTLAARPETPTKNAPEQRESPEQTEKKGADNNGNKAA